MSVYSNNDLSKQTPNDAWFKIFQYIDPDTNILDIGCSSGKLGEALREQKNVHIVGLDIDTQDVELAKRNLNEAHLINIETDDLGFLGQFDAIIFADVIEHLLDPVAALKKIKPLLKKNGKVIFSIPNMANVTIRIELLKGNFEYKDFGLLDRTHLHFYDKKEVQRVFNEAGYQVVDTDCTLREIPEDLLRSELKPLGIELAPKLSELLNSAEAITYQFIGYAQLTDKPQKFTPKTTSPLDSVSIQIDNIKSQYDELLKAKDAELIAKTKHIKQLDNRVNLLDAELLAVHTSKSWKLIQKVRNVKNKAG